MQLIKSITTNPWLFLPWLAFLSAGCLTKPAEKEHYVDDYQPTLLSAEGTAFSGDYFPFETGYTWKWRGAGEVEGDMTFDGETMEIPKETIIMEGDLEVQNPTTIALKEGAVEVYPLKETALMQDGESAVSRRFFKKGPDEVYIKAVELKNGALLEIEDPIYIKKEMEAGDSWKSSPNFDVSQLVSAMDTDELPVEPKITVNINCKSFVLGQETVNIQGAEYNSIVMEQRALITMGMDLSQYGSMKVTGKIDIRLNLVDGIGIAMQKLSQDISITGTIKDAGQSASFSMNMKTSSDMELEEYDFNPSGTDTIIVTYSVPNSGSLAKSAPSQAVITNPGAALAVKLIEKITGILGKNHSLQKAGGIL